jgi:hypothetical protein
MGPVCQREERGGRVPFRAEAVLGRGRFGGWAEMASPSLFLFFFVLSSFLFLFLVYFISFSKLVQIDSNQFVNFSKIPSNLPEQ